ncbi:MAG: GNAT family N-acetyltransferase [Alphaproteobacteria bacterium]|uniref:GNAT family N-acetyltransferase n=1 Tax=Brevundimonas sp. TaxID=1871086 RepID=UPI0018046206|nr:GNAT family N-acetyltransferase [Brevundimonas sp.]MBU3969591.1 GNAT family N-acetyltransferase [Alphaproteobacteria bacterium]MBA3051209.1 GNAT family N-acetyltransferase [Brevundimonas sp.]MBU3972293.1 GNAT family N-acetyltransferase [Alphaproteobacteria bacterium]MBU4038351.1 GNAT family N-acetyltransferase [Alphaproteobacteria bacterium]MBU4135779.1 GNAT family N-acetyltransferase [Alphaproteobacteria bacterium]
MTGPVLETERLILRPIAMEDFPRWAEMMGDAEAAKFLGGAQPAAVAWRGFMSMAGAWSLTGVSMFSLIERGTGLWLGRIGPWRPHDWPGTEVGWGLHPDAQGKGYGVEAATAALDYAFDVLGWTDVIHCIDPANTPSQRLAERVGSRNLGPTRLPPPFQDLPMERWGQSREEWRARPR